MRSAWLYWQQLTIISLLGLFIWAIDLDNKDHDALKAVLGGELGVFAKQNGYDPTFTEDDSWESVTGSSCDWSGKYFARFLNGVISTTVESDHGRTMLTPSSMWFLMQCRDEGRGC
jgi:hypothetical protein